MQVITLPNQIHATGDSPRTQELEKKTVNYRLFKEELQVLSLTTL